MGNSKAFRLDASLWPTIADSFTGPWPDEAIQADIQWWSVVGSRPGRPTLARRWGISDRKARAWISDYRPQSDDGLSDEQDSLSEDLALPFQCEPESLSHGDLCHLGWRWLRAQGFSAVVEPTTCIRMTPDVFGWAGDFCLIIEAKRTPSDYGNDLHKSPSPAPGNLRWYLVPEGVAYAPCVPAGWGLIEVRPDGLFVTKPAPLRTLGEMSSLGGRLMVASVTDRLHGGWSMNSMGRMVRQ